MMMNSGFANRPVEILPDEGRLVRQAKAGDADAFSQLYDVCVEQVYRYIYFRVANDRIAEGVTFQVFFKAWEQLDRYQSFRSSFITWLYEIARNQIIAYFRTHKKTLPLDNSFSLTSDGRYLGEEVHDMFDLQAMRDSLQFLTEEEQQFLTLKFIVGLPMKNIARMMARSENEIRALQVRSLQTLARYLKEKELV
jgi:RNA polymerase sigma-70 factor (ECF subfamily)